MKTIFTSIFLALVMVPCSLYAWGNGSGRPNMTELIPKMSSETAYTERYGFAVDLDEGGHIGVDFTLSNLGWGSGHGAVEVRVNLPNQPNYRHSKKVGSGDWSYSKDKFGLKIDNTEVTQVGNSSFRIVHRGSTPFDITFENKMPMWKPASGKIDVDGGGYYQFNLIAPRADVTGKVKGVDIVGTRAGYADHVATNVAPFDFATRFTRMRNYNGDVFVLWREITLTKAHGGKSLTWVMVGFKDEIVFSDANARLREGNIKVDPATKYRIPLTIQIDGKKGGDSIKFVARGKNYKKRDLLDDYGSVARLVASAFAKPVRYTVDMEYQLQMTIKGATATISGTSHYVVDQLN